jgi:chromosome segregation ATPase
MSNEEFQTRMEFLLAHQAQFASDIQQLRESQSVLQTAQVQTEQVVVQTGEIVARLANVTLEGFKDVNAKINALVDSQINLTDAQSRTDEKFRELADSQKQTTEDLNKLIANVDRYFSDGRNGNSHFRS